MKTKSILLSDNRFFWLTALLVCIVINNLPAQELEQQISSKLEVIDEQDHQILDCNTYRFENKILYDNPNAIRLYKNAAYRFDFRFTYFGDQGLISPKNYLGKSYAVQIEPSLKKNYRIQAISPNDDKISIYAITEGKVGLRDTFRIQLLDDRGKLLADAIYPFDIQSDEPGATMTAYMPMKIEYKPIYITLEDANNTNNRIERQLLPFSNDTINIDAKNAYNLLTEIEEQVQIGNESYVLVADHEKNYGYQVSYSWEGKGLQYKPGSQNGMKSYLTTVPGRSNSGAQPVLNISAIMAADLKRSGLDQKGERVQQQLTFIEPKTNLKKRYQKEYLRANPGVLRSRTDQQRLQYQVRQNIPRVSEELKVATQKNFHYFKVDQATKMKLQKMQMAQTPAKTSATKTQPATRSYMAKQNMAIAKQKENVAIARPYYPITAVTQSGKNNNYYTMAIQVSRETDAMSYRTYLVTFRIIE